MDELLALVKDKCCTCDLLYGWYCGHDQVLRSVEEIVKDLMQQAREEEFDGV